MIKAIVIDLDRTTLRSDGSLSKRTESAIELALNNEIEIIVASGRAFSTLPDNIISNKNIKWAITSNGAVIHKDKKEKRRLLLNPTAVEEIVCRFKKYPFEIFIDGKPFADSDFVKNPCKYGVFEKSVAYIQSTRTPVSDFPDFILENKNRLDSIDIIVPSMEENISVRAELENINGIRTTSSIVQLVEVADKNAGKENGLAFISKELGIPLGRFAAFGDAENDIGMLSVAGLGIAVSNACEKCKKAADTVCDSNDNDGVAKEIEKIVQRNK